MSGKAAKASWRLTETQLQLFNLVMCLEEESRNRTGVAHRVPGGLGSQIFMTFGT
jgi:hypothetical protein